MSTPTRKRGAVGSSSPLKQTRPKRVKMTADGNEHGNSESNASDSDADAEEAEEGIKETQGFIAETVGEAHLHAMSKPAKTSNHRFSTHFEEPFTRESFQAAFKSDLEANSAKRLRLQHDYRPRYALWQTELVHGFTLLFHGVGSKRTLLNDFANTLARHGTVIAVNGYALSVTIADVLSAIEAQIGPNKEAPSAKGHTSDKHESRASALCRTMSRKKTRPLYLVIHNLDALNMRSQKAIHALAQLASHPKIHLVASVDHVRAMVLFPTALANALAIPEDEVFTDTRHGFTFLHHHTPTFEPYTEEVLHSETLATLFPPTVYPSSTSLKSDMSVAARIQGVMSVVASSNDNARLAFRNLASRQLANYDLLSGESEAFNLHQLASTRAPPVAVASSTFFIYCRDHFLASTEAQMQSLLFEFRDHDILASSSEAPEAVAEHDQDGGAEADDTTEWLWIRLNKEPLKMVIDKMDSL